MKLQFPSTLCLSKNQAPCHCFVWTPKKIICGSFISKNMQKPMVIQLFSKNLSCPSINVIIQRTSDIHLKLLLWTIQYSTQTNTCQTTPLDNVTLDQSAYTSVSNYIHVYKKYQYHHHHHHLCFNKTPRILIKRVIVFKLTQQCKSVKLLEEQEDLIAFLHLLYEVFPVFSSQNRFTT